MTRRANKSSDEIFNNIYDDDIRAIDTDWLVFDTLGIVSGTNIHVSGTVSPGTAVTIPAGRYLFVVTGETVHVASNVTQISGSGSPFVNGTQIKMYVPQTANYVFCSAGGTGLVSMTKVKEPGPGRGGSSA